MSRAPAARPSAEAPWRLGVHSLPCAHLRTERLPMQPGVHSLLRAHLRMERLPMRPGVQPCAHLRTERLPMRPGGYRLDIRRFPIIPRPGGVAARLVRLDARLFARVARADTPWLDRGLPPLSRSANHSGLWIAIGGSLAAGAGRRGQRAAVRGLGSIAVTSLVVNEGIKRVVRRPRPVLRGVPAVRRVNVPPLTTSFPSGHAASAAAFAAGVAVELPIAGPPLAALAVAVGGSRVYVGVHYPVDVLVGAGIGAGVAQLTRRLWPVLPARADDVPPSTDCRHIASHADGRGVVVGADEASGSGRRR